MKDYIAAINNAGGEVYLVGGHVGTVLYNKFHSTNIKTKDSDPIISLKEEMLQ